MPHQVAAASDPCIEAVSRGADRQRRDVFRAGSSADMGRRRRWKVIVGLALTTLTGCEHTVVYAPPGAEVLTADEMDQITVGSATATVDAAAGALPPGSAAALTSTSTLSQANASPGYLGSNFSNSQLSAAAISGQSAEVSGTSHTFVSSSNGGAWIDATGVATAAGGQSSQAQLGMQFYGISTARADLVFGLAVANACCAPDLGAQVKASAGAGGPYSIEIQGNPVSDTLGSVQSRVDIAVASSALPIVDPGQVMELPIARGSPKY